MWVNTGCGVGKSGMWGELKRVVGWVKAECGLIRDVGWEKAECGLNRDVGWEKAGCGVS